MTPEDLEQVRKVMDEVLAAGLQRLLRDAERRGALEVLRQADTDGKRTLSINEAVKRYGRTRGRIQELFERGVVRGKWITGRGRGGRELSLNRADLDREFGVGE